MSGDIKFTVLVSLFVWMQKSKSSAVKRSKFRKFLDTFCKPCDYFSAIRVILPSLDRERGSYGLKESVLATCLVDALGMARDSEDALRLFNWRRGGPKTGANAGSFALVATEVLQRRQGLASGGLTIKELNELLDRLASSENRAEKISILSTLIKKTNAQEMKWIIMILLKDLKLGISEKSIFHEFHPDAEDLFNVTCDLKLVCERLKDRRQRHKRQDIEVGKPVRPQLAMRISNAATAWKKLHGKEVVVECKFDGDRIQIHKRGTEVHYFSRNFLDHSEYEHGMTDIIVQNVLVDRCILDGEMLVWDKSLNRFADFGSNQEIAKAAKEGLETDRQLCYVAFDILYAGDTSVIHQSLKERHELLQKVLKPLNGRLEILVPDGGLNSHGRTGQPSWSQMAHTLDDVEKFFKETVENRDEGIVLKDLGSKWEPSDRSGKWLKLKPDYIRASSDLDVLIIGGYYGSGRRGGEVAQFLVGLAERPASNTYPRRFTSFCRVGTGLSDDELDAVVTKLKPYFRKYEYPKKAPPNFYHLTNHSKERPDVWIESPEKSLILAITSDIRTISSGTFAAPYSLRFPRIDRVRWDKPWHECLDVQSFVELVHSSNGTIQRANENNDIPSGSANRRKISEKGRGGRKTIALVPSRFTQTDVSTVKWETGIFSNKMFYFVNTPSDLSLDTLHKMVVENGGTFSMNLNNSVTHCIAAESKGIKFQAAKRNKDVVHYSWVLDCCSQKKLLHLLPKYFLFLSDTSKKSLQAEIDEFSDSYFWDLDLADIKQLLSNVKSSEDHRSIEHYKKKFSPDEKWSLFHGCHIHIRSLAPTIKSEWDVLLVLPKRRLELEVSWGGGKVATDLAYATHLVVLAVAGTPDDSHALSESLDVAEKRLLRRKNLHVVGLKWLEDCLENGHKLPEDPYKLQITAIADSIDEEWKDEVEVDTKTVPHCHDEEENRKVKAAASEHGETENSSKVVTKRKRGRPLTVSVSTRQQKTRASQARRTRPRLAKKPLKLSEHDSDGSASGGEAETLEDKTVEDVKDARNESSDGGFMVAAKEYSSEEEVLPPKEEVPKKIEIMTDPVHAMLLHMIPSLGTKKIEATTTTSTTTTATTTSWASDDVKEVVGEPSEEEPMVVKKKKKVSYKDLAGELLKDW